MQSSISLYPSGFKTQLLLPLFLCAEESKVII